VADWLGFAFALLALVGAVVALESQRRTLRRLRHARVLAEDWTRMADARRMAGDPADAERLRYCSYWLLQALAGRG
jgi:hypothetical protein